MNSLPIRFGYRICWIAWLFVFAATPASAQLDYERPPILYSESEPSDRVAQFAAQLRDGQTQLTWDEQHGYLKSLLNQLEIPVSSQTLVFSKTSLQISRITPHQPRALYFSDDIYIGWVQRGDVIEISAADPVLGGTFYTLSQKQSEAPELQRETSRCLQCHGSTHTRRVPGHIVRSVYPAANGQPVFRLGTHLTDNRSPFEERWGGWYVTGTHGTQRHLGNSFLSDPDRNEELDTEAGANLTDLSTLINTAPYLSAHSDIVALMVLQHQARMHNVLTAASHSGRLTARDAIVMNQALERPLDFESESTQRRYQSAAEKVVRALLFCDEWPLSDPVKGTSTFALEFEARGPSDRSGRSLRQFDLQKRLFRYPCSFLIYSDSYQQLPPGVLTRAEALLQRVLAGQDDSGRFEHLSEADRKAIAAILAETRAGQ